MSVICLTWGGRLENCDGLEIYENALSFLPTISKGAATAQSFKMKKVQQIKQQSIKD